MRRCVNLEPWRNPSLIADRLATSDGMVLDRCRHWVNLVREIIAERIPGAWLLKLAPAEQGKQEPFS